LKQQRGDDPESRRPCGKDCLRGEIFEPKPAIWPFPICGEEIAGLCESYTDELASLSKAYGSVTILAPMKQAIRPPPDKSDPSRSKKLSIEMLVTMSEVKIGLMIILIGSLLLSVYLTARPR